jgi:hypothetical protein
MRDNAPRLSIYTLNIYSTLFVAQAISKVVAWALNYLTPKIPWDQKLVDRCLDSLCEEIFFF